MIEETLDPQDWERMRALGHRMVDDMLENLRTVRERPAWKPIPEASREFLGRPAPLDATEPEEVYERFRQHVLPYPIGNIHPRFWGWVIGSGSPMGMFAELLSGGMNTNVFGGEQSAVEVEAQVVGWFRELFGFPETATGVLVSGGTEANFTGLAVGRTARAGYDVCREGVRRPMTIYASQQVHSSVQKAAELLGIGDENLRRIEVDSELRMSVPALREAIEADRRAGLHPLAVCATVGTVNTGAIDPVHPIADLCAEQGLWLHVDAAFGATAALSPELRDKVDGIERADSLAFDLHKWLHIQYSAACVLVRDRDSHHRTFSPAGSYLAHAPSGAASGEQWPSEYALSLSRTFNALKVWMAVLESGFEKLGRLALQNVNQAAYLASLVERHPDFELLAPVPLNVVCLRYRWPGAGDTELNSFNQKLLISIHQSGVAVPSGTSIDGRFGMRVAITNHRSRREDFDLFIGELVRLAQELLVARP